MTLLKMIGQALLNAVALIIVLILAVVFGYAYYKSKKSDKVNKDATRLIIEVDKIYEDKPESALSTSEATLYYHDLIKGLKHLASDDQIKEIILKIDDIKLLSVQIEELRPIFRKIKEKKKVIALATTLDKASYQAALLADEIYLLDTNNANVSLRAHVFSDMYYKPLLDKLGIKLTPVHIGDYKVAGENYGRETMSEARRQSLKQTGRGLLDYLVQLIKEERGIEIEEDILSGDLVLIDRKQATDYGLVDGEKSEKDLGLNNEDENITFSKYLKNINKNIEKEEKPNIAVLYLEGNIAEKSNATSYISLKNVKEKIKELKKDKSIKGLVLRVNSPGGSALESELIYRELKALDMPIYASMGDYAASGGYYLSVACDKIYANNNTLTGSIGVVGLLPELKGAIDKLGVNYEAVSLGEGSNFLNIYEPQSEKSKELLNKSLEDTYKEFKSRVIEARGMSDEELEEIAGGRVWLGQEAVDNGLVDDIKNLDQVVTQLSKDLEIDKPIIKVYREKQSVKDLTANLNPFAIDEVIKANSGIMYIETIDVK